MLRIIISALAACALLLIGLAIQSAHAQTAHYAAANWNGDRIHLLDSDFNSISDFAAGEERPNGVAFDGEYIYSGHFIGDQVFGYEMDGTVVLNWTNAEAGSLQALSYINSTGELAFNDDDDDIAFVDPADGTLNRILDIGGVCSGFEGMAYIGDGEAWLLCNDGLFLVDINTGDLIDSVASPTDDCSFGGTAIAPAGDGLLALGCTNGDWFLWNPADETLADSGNNGLSMYGLAPLGFEPTPAPPALAVPAGSVISWLILAMSLLLVAVTILNRRGRPV